MSVGIITSKPASVPHARLCDLKLARELLVIYFLTANIESHDMQMNFFMIALEFLMYTNDYTCGN